MTGVVSSRAYANKKDPIASKGQVMFVCGFLASCCGVRHEKFFCGWLYCVLVCSQRAGNLFEG